MPAKNIIGEEGGLSFFWGGNFKCFESKCVLKQHQRTGRWVKFVDLSYCGISEEKTMMLDVGKNKLYLVLLVYQFQISLGMGFTYQMMQFQEER